jgi:hypothetical protein
MRIIRGTGRVLPPVGGRFSRSIIQGLSNPTKTPSIFKDLYRSRTFP